MTTPIRSKRQHRKPFAASPIDSVRFFDRVTGNLSPAGFTATSAAILNYLPIPLAGVLFQVAVAGSLCCAAIGIVLVRIARAAHRRLGCRLLFLAFGLLLGTYSLVVAHQSRAFTGLPLSGVSGYEFLLTDDSVKTKTGNTFYRGSLLEVHSRDGTSATAKGSIVVFGEAVARSWGTRLRVEGPLESGEKLGSDWVGSCKVDAIRAVDEGNWYFVVRNRARGWVAKRLHVLSNADSALFMALFLGARDDLSGEETYFFRQAGAVHLLALSGFHLGILSFILIALLSPLLGRARAAAVAATFLSLYLFIAGPKVSLLRAVIMFGLLGACRLSAVRARGIDLLAFSFLCNMLMWPSSLKTISFQLSYLALAGILSLGPAIERLLTTWVPKMVRLPAAAAVAAHLATIGLLAARFGYLYPIGTVSSLVLTPLVTAFFWSGLACVFLPVPVSVVPIVAEAVSLLHRVLINTAEFFGRSTPLHASGPAGTLAVSLCGILFLIAVNFGRYLRRGSRRPDPPEPVIGRQSTIE